MFNSYPKYLVGVYAASATVKMVAFWNITKIIHFFLKFYKMMESFDENFINFAKRPCRNSVEFQSESY